MYVRLGKTSRATISRLLAEVVMSGRNAKCEWLKNFFTLCTDARGERIQCKICLKDWAYSTTNWSTTKMAKHFSREAEKGSKITVVECSGLDPNSKLTQQVYEKILKDLTPVTTMPKNASEGYENLFGFSGKQVIHKKWAEAAVSGGVAYAFAENPYFREFISMIIKHTANAIKVGLVCAPCTHIPVLSAVRPRPPAVRPRPPAFGVPSALQYHHALTQPTARTLHAHPATQLPPIVLSCPALMPCCCVAEQHVEIHDVQQGVRARVRQEERPQGDGSHVGADEGVVPHVRLHVAPAKAPPLPHGAPSTWRRGPAAIPMVCRLQPHPILFIFYLNWTIKPIKE